MRVAIVTESFLPTLNGVTTSVCRVSEQLYAGGHDVRIVAPAPAPDRFGEIRVATCPLGVGAAVPDRTSDARATTGPGGLRPGGRPRRLAVRARRARAPVGGPHPDPSRRHLPDRCAQLPRPAHARQNRHPSLERRMALDPAHARSRRPHPSPPPRRRSRSSGTTAYRGWSGGAGAWTTPSPRGGEGTQGRASSGGRCPRPGRCSSAMSADSPRRRNSTVSQKPQPSPAPDS